MCVVRKSPDTEPLYLISLTNFYERRQWPQTVIKTQPDLASNISEISLITNNIILPHNFRLVVQYSTHSFNIININILSPMPLMMDSIYIYKAQCSFVCPLNKQMQKFILIVSYSTFYKLTHWNTMLTRIECAHGAHWEASRILLNNYWVGWASDKEILSLNTLNYLLTLNSSAQYLALSISLVTKKSMSSQWLEENRQFLVLLFSTNSLISLGCLNTVIMQLNIFLQSNIFFSMITLLLCWSWDTW